jgi:hypothetical protein
MRFFLRKHAFFLRFSNSQFLTSFMRIMRISNSQVSCVPPARHGGTARVRPVSPPPARPGTVSPSHGPRRPGTARVRPSPPPAPAQSESLAPRHGGTARVRPGKPAARLPRHSLSPRRPGTKVACVNRVFLRKPGFMRKQSFTA